MIEVCPDASDFSPMVVGSGLSIDATAVHYPRNRNPSEFDVKLKELAGWLEAGKAPVDPGLSAYLYPKLATGVAGALQEQQGKEAGAEFQRLLDQKLTKPNGRKRQLFLRAANEHFDSYGRLLKMPTSMAGEPGLILTH